jgi:hypothetical protein
MAMSIADSCQLILFVGSRCRNGAVVSSRFRPLHASSFVCWRFFLLNLPPSQICIPNHGMETPSSGLYTNFFASFQGNICVSIFCLFLCFIQCIIYILWWVWRKIITYLVQRFDLFIKLVPYGIPWQKYSTRMQRKKGAEESRFVTLPPWHPMKWCLMLTSDASTLLLLVVNHQLVKGSPRASGLHNT